MMNARTNEITLLTYPTSKVDISIQNQVTEPSVQYKLRTAAAQQKAVGTTDMPVSKTRRVKATVRVGGSDVVLLLVLMGSRSVGMVASFRWEVTTHQPPLGM